VGLPRGWTGLVAIGAIGCNAVLGLKPSTLRDDAEASDASAEDDAANPGTDGGPGGGDSGGRGEGGPMGSPDGSGGDACPGACAASTTRCAERGVQTCGAQAGGCPGWSTTMTCSAALVCERAGEAACVDPEWAEWPVPNSPADVAAGAPNLERYTDNGDDTVTDNVTQLMWQKTAPSTVYSQTDALTHCSGLTQAGYDDWRLPTEIELISLIDFGSSSPCMDTRYFPNASSDAFWSATPSSTSSALAWGVTFLNGSVGTNAIALPYGARCVR
jgi:Protein of unknown function (DUF1566)